VVEWAWAECTEADSEVATELDTEADMEADTEVHMELELVMAVATAHTMVALTGVPVKIAAAQLAGLLAGLPAGQQVAAVQVAAVQAAGTDSTQHRLCLMLGMAWVITLRRLRTGMWDVELVSLEPFKCRLRLGQTIVAASSFPSCCSCCSRFCTTSCRLLPPPCLRPFLRRP